MTAGSFPVSVWKSDGPEEKAMMTTETGEGTIFITRPEEIEARSMEIITAELASRGITLEPETAGVIKRCIHTSADFDYYENLYFSPGAVPALEEALLRGASVVTDTEMAKAGIRKKTLEKMGGEALCFMSDPVIAREAALLQETRARRAVFHTASLSGEKIYAVGNAPTALLALHELITDGKLVPGGIIAVPVGFVNVTEAKEQIIRLSHAHPGIPVIAARGRKGGSNVAAAIVNALLIGAGERNKTDLE